jgi:hypothetical protein
MDDYVSGDVLKVTSTHHQMMRPSTDGEILAIAHRAKTFLSANNLPKPRFDTEVVWYNGFKTLCYQPHPEYDVLPPNRKYFLALLEHFNGK